MRLTNMINKYRQQIGWLTRLTRLTMGASQVLWRHSLRQTEIEITGGGEAAEVKERITSEKGIRSYVISGSPRFAHFWVKSARLCQMPRLSYAPCSHVHIGFIKERANGGFRWVYLNAWCEREGRPREQPRLQWQAESSACVVTAPHQSSKQERWPKAVRRWFAGIRQIIETVNDKLLNTFPLARGQEPMSSSGFKLVWPLKWPCTTFIFASINTWVGPF